MKPYAIVLREQSNGWAWRLKAPNGRTVAQSYDVFPDRASASRAADRIVQVAEAGRIRKEAAND